MLKKRYMIISSLVFCLTATFFISGTASEEPPQEYNPWYDVDDNGWINIIDINQIAVRFGTTGTPINKTALLIEVNATFAKLLERIEALETGGFIGAPARDSGWMFISKGQHLPYYHNLNTTEVLVCVYGKSSANGIHNIRYGGNWGGTGLTWEGLDDDELTLYRWNSDNDWEQVRVMIWKIQSLPPP